MKSTYYINKKNNYADKEELEENHKEKSSIPLVKESEILLPVNIDKELDFQKLKNTKLFKKFLKEQEADPKKNLKPMNNNKPVNNIKDNKKVSYTEKKSSPSKSKHIPSFTTFNLSDESDLQSAKIAFAKVNQANDQFKTNELVVSFKKSNTPKKAMHWNDEYSIVSQEENFPQFGRTNDSQRFKKQNTSEFNPSEELQGYSEIIPGFIL